MGLAIGLPMAFQPLTRAVELEDILSPEFTPQLVVAPESPQVPEIGKASQYLPGRAAVHLVLRIGERRVYVYRGEEVLASYPVAVGKEGWETPTGDFEVINMEVDPVFLSLWTGNKIGPGPDNPLGPRWIGFWTDNKTQVGFHGTNYPELIGQAVSHGCVRMHNKDVLALYEQVELGTKVIVEQ